MGCVTLQSSPVQKLMMFMHKALSQLLMHMQVPAQAKWDLSSQRSHRYAGARARKNTVLPSLAIIQDRTVMLGGCVGRPHPQPAWASCTASLRLACKTLWQGCCATTDAESPGACTVLGTALAYSRFVRCSCADRISPLRSQVYTTMFQP